MSLEIDDDPSDKVEKKIPKEEKLAEPESH